MKLNLRTHISALCTVVAMAAVMTPAHATELVTNGGFETTTGPGMVDYNTTVTGWTNGISVTDNAGHFGYNFLFTAGSGDTTGSNGDSGNLKLWGTNNGGNDVLTASPDGGNFLVMDGAYQEATISQTINGLIAGQQYTVSFYYAGAQQSGFNGDTTETYTVSFGGSSQTAPVLHNGSHDFTGWQQETMTFTADGTSDVLSFLAVGTPHGVPPMSLLDGVSVQAAASPVPEPASLALLMTGFAGIGGMVRARFKK